MTEQDRITHLIAQSRNNETTFTTDEQSVAMLRTNFAQLVSLASGYWFEEFSEAFQVMRLMLHMSRCRNMREISILLCIDE